MQWTWEGQSRNVGWRDPQGVAPDFRIEPTSKDDLLIAPRHGVRTCPFAHSLSPKNTFPNRLSVGISPMLTTRQIYDVACDEGGLVWVLHGASLDDGLGPGLLSAFDRSGDLRWSGATPAAGVDEGLIETVGVRVCNGLRVRHARLGRPRPGSRPRPNRWLPPIDVGREIRSVSTSPLHTRARLVVCLEEGGRIVWATISRRSGLAPISSTPARASPRTASSRP